ncbi:MAG: shikimate dehydrogenase family protein [Thermoguttaceae bacterium]
MSSPAVQPILALLACPVGGNPIQYVVEKAFAHLNLDWRFLSLEVAPEGLADAVRGMRAMGFRGGKIADPHRRAILPLLDGTTDTATLLGRVNFFVGEENRLLGDNTEGRGLVESLRRVTDPAGKRCLILNSGELAQGVAVELASAGAAEIRMADPSPEQAAGAAGLLIGKFPATFSSLVWEGSFHVPEDIDVVIHALSLEPHDAKTHRPFDAASLRPELIVADLAIDPDEAWLLREATARGCKTIDGLGALVEQMAVDFHLWTLLDPDRPLMREAVEEFLEL